MELEEMKKVWNNMEQRKKFIPFQISEASHLTYNKKITHFKIGEIIGLVVAYTFAGVILYTSIAFDNWYLRLCGGVLVIYLVIMPIFTLIETWKMKHIDLARSNCKDVLEQIYKAKNNLKVAEKISFIASPIIFISAITILIKLILDKNLFTLNIRFTGILFIGFALSGALFFNAWAFKNRDKEFKSVKQLLDDNNQY